MPKQDVRVTYAALPIEVCRTTIMMLSSCHLPSDKFGTEQDDE
jgi:hypothetical protein